MEDPCREQVPQGYMLSSTTLLPSDFICSAHFVCLHCCSRQLAYATVASVEAIHLDLSSAALPAACLMLWGTQDTQRHRSLQSGVYGTLPLAVALVFLSPLQNHTSTYRYRSRSAQLVHTRPHTDIVRPKVCTCFPKSTKMLIKADPDPKTITASDYQIH